MHTWVAGPRNLDPYALTARHLHSDFFTLVHKSVKPYRSPVPFLNCIFEAVFPGTKSLWHESLRTSLCPCNGSKVNQLWKALQG